MVQRSGLGPPAFVSGGASPRRPAAAQCAPHVPGCWVGRRRGCFAGERTHLHQTMAPTRPGRGRGVTGGQVLLGGRRLLQPLSSPPLDVPCQLSCLLRAPCPCLRMMHMRSRLACHYAVLGMPALAPATSWRRPRAVSSSSSCLCPATIQALGFRVSNTWRGCPACSSTRCMIPGNGPIHLCPTPPHGPMSPVGSVGLKCNRSTNRGCQCEAVQYPDADLCCHVALPPPPLLLEAPHHAQQLPLGTASAGASLRPPCFGFHPLQDPVPLFFHNCAAS